MDIILSSETKFLWEEDKKETKPFYRSKDWKSAAQRMDKRKKKTGWLDSFYKSCIFILPTPGGELKKRMQAKEKELLEEERNTLLK